VRLKLLYCPARLEIVTEVILKIRSACLSHIFVVTVYVNYTFEMWMNKGDRKNQI
jgi:hypothetical protein